jgi:hypothetical protein
MWHDVVTDMVAHEPGVHVAGITPPRHLILLTPTLQLTLGGCEKGSHNITILIGNGVMFAMQAIEQVGFHAVIQVMSCDHSAWQLVEPGNSLVAPKFFLAFMLGFVGFQLAQQQGNIPPGTIGCEILFTHVPIESLMIEVDNCDIMAPLEEIQGCHTVYATRTCHIQPWRQWCNNFDHLSKFHVFDCHDPFLDINFIKPCTVDIHMLCLCLRYAC